VPDSAAIARELIDTCQYLTLATADGDGRPWASPVWYAHEDYTRFVWVSKPEARHSRNLAARPQAGIVIFDSTVRVGEGQAVYVEATVQELASEEDDDERWIGVFSARSEALGGPAWSARDVRPPAPLRLYVASASAHYVLGARDERVAVSLG
jgi:nitroimidazol reductase NimA-like FMN-containing flavoprotein (pyridoxamine 5'-phosphate oxidase superfamily)